MRRSPMGVRISTLQQRVAERGAGREYHNTWYVASGLAEGTAKNLLSVDTSKSLISSASMSVRTIMSTSWDRIGQIRNGSRVELHLISHAHLGYDVACHISHRRRYQIDNYADH
jgi:hypothetical protein